MDVKRGDLVAVSLPGDYGKPRPALVVRSDAFADHPSVTVLPLTGELIGAPLLRVRLEPDASNGLFRRSDVMVDKATTLPKSKVGAAIGVLGRDIMAELDRRLALFLGIAK